MFPALLPRRVIVHVASAALAIAISAPAARSQDRIENLTDKLETIHRSIVLDGSSITNCGNLQMNVTNFGFLGSLPNSRYPMSDSPSAQWPVGSGIEYLYAAGLWVGAEMEGVPSVSTGYPETEFYPGEGPIDDIYRAVEGMKGGRNYPSNPDDDGDGRVNEDWLNGRDDDGDGLIDEDFAEIGNLMYSCWFTDDLPLAQKVWPEHTPLNLRVRQETYQWSEEGFNNFVGVHYDISNQGMRFLQNVYVGIYADLDAGPRNAPNYYKDDQIGHWAGIWCAPVSGIDMPERIQTLYVYDADGDNGKTKGYFGIVLLGSRTEILGPRGSVISSGFDEANAIRMFAGLLPYDRGGEPINDFQRYSVLSGAYLQPNTETPNDYKALISVGPFYELMPEQSIQLDIAFVGGEGLEGFLANAAMAKFIYTGTRIDGDKNSQTGINGRETMILGNEYTARFGIDPDYCDGVDETKKLPIRDTLWINADCVEEKTLWEFQDCYKGSMAFEEFRTGVHGRETQINWVSSAAPPPPGLRALPGDGTVSVIWDNLSEVTPDPVTRRIEFEGYQVWRADDWHRPIGTTVASGPSADLWHMLDSRDLMNGIEPDLDLKRPWREGGYQYEPLRQVGDREAFVRAFEENLRYDPLGAPPCPPGITQAECDTFAALARWNLGFEGGRQYYMYLDREVKNGLPYFYSIVAYEPPDTPGLSGGVGRANSPYSNFTYVVPRGEALEPEEYAAAEVYVVPNPVTSETMEPWRLEPNNADPSGEKMEFRDLPRCRSTVRIFTIAGDLVQTLHHDGSSGKGTLGWNLVSRNGQTVTSGVYIFTVEPENGRFARFVGKFVVIR